MATRRSVPVEEEGPRLRPISAPADDDSLPDANGGGNSTSETALADGSELSDAVVNREAVMTAEHEATFGLHARRFRLLIHAL